MTTVFLPSSREAAEIERKTAGEMLRRWANDAANPHTGFILRLAAESIERGHHYQSPAEFNRRPRLSGTLDKDMLSFLRRHGGHWSGSTYDLSIRIRASQPGVQASLKRLEEAGLLSWRRRMGLGGSEVALKPLAAAVDMRGQG